MLIKKTALLTTALFVCTAAQCNVNVNVNTGTPLDDAIATLSIEREDTDANAILSGSITAGFANVELTDEQSIQLNGVELDRAGSLFTATVPAASAYILRVVEPTRGVETTTINEPSAFEITSPTVGTAVSLSGFNVTWNNVEADLTVRVVVRQTLLDESLVLNIGPVADTGMVSITDAQIAQAGFGQGANVRIEVIRERETNDLNGFAAGSLTATLSTEVEVGTAP